MRCARHDERKHSEALENLYYALTQLVHNFGAATVLGGAFFVRWPTRATLPAARRIAWLVLGGWLAQAASGTGFGIVSYTSYGQLPDIHGVAIAALLIKIACTVSALALTGCYLRAATTWSATRRDATWTALCVLAATALAAAAFLRWYS